MASPAPPPSALRCLIVGCPRSGTTLLSVMLDSHPRLAVPGESHFIPLFARMRRRYAPTGRGFRVEHFARDLLSHPRFRLWGLPSDLVMQRLARDRPGDLGAAIDSVYRCYAEYRGKEYAGDKTPRYVFHVPLLAGLLPQAKFIHIVRDPRDVVSSLLRVQDWGPASAGEAALLWRRAVLSGRRAGLKLGPGRYREVRYEELVADPPRTLAGLASFLDLEYSEDMLRYPSGAKHAQDAHLHPHHHANIGSLPYPNSGVWRSRMSPDAAALVELLAGPALETLGYRREVGGPPGTMPPGVRRSIEIGRDAARRALRIGRRFRHPARVVLGGRASSGKTPRAASRRDGLDG